jgi:hypothetical protein
MKSEVYCIEDVGIRNKDWGLWIKERGMRNEDISICNDWQSFFLPTTIDQPTKYIPDIKEN